jgi:hypothetical protein
MRGLLAAAALAAPLCAPLPAHAAAFALPVPATGPETVLSLRKAYSAAENRAIRRCMRSQGLPARWGGRGGQMARSAHVDACARKLYGA